MRSKLLISILLAGCSVTPTAQPVRHDNPKIASLVSSGALVLDVRSPEEYSAGHIQEAKNVPYDRIANEAATLEPSRDKPVVIYCKTGRRAEIARQALLRLGFNEVVNAGGYEDIRRDLKRTTD